MPISLKPFLQRLREDLPTLVLLALMLVLTSASIIIADWTEGLRGLTTIALLGLLTGYLLAYSDFSEWTALTIGTIYGGFVIGLQQVLLLPTGQPLRQRALVFVERLGTWLVSAVTGGAAPDNLIFVVWLAALLWFVGYSAAWNMFRGQRLWRAVVPPGIALLVNLTYYVGDARLDVGLLAFLFAALLLAVRTNTVAREHLWRDRRMTFRPGTRFDLLRAGVLASVGLLALAWFAPTGNADDRLSSVWEEQVAPRIDLAETWNRLFSLEGSDRNVAADYYGGRTLTLGGAINLSDEPVMDVSAPPGPRYYWRSKTFDTFDGHAWFTTSDARIRSEFGVLYYEDPNYQLRRNVRQRFDLRMPTTRLLYSASQPTSVSLPVVFDVLFIDRSQERGTLHSLQAENLLHDGDSYEAISSISYADENSLRAAGTDYPGWVRRAYLGLPQSTTDRTRQLAAELAAPYDNPFDKAQAIENWLRQNITYDQNISSPPQEANAVDWVLFEQPRGYCNYYASAMVVLLRSQDIPARIATGFAQGEYDPRTQSFQVVESDAHSWVEVYFPGYGWVEFEPTAAQPAILERGDTGTEGGAAALPGEAVPPDVPPAEQEALESPGNLNGSQGLSAGLPGTGRGRVPLALLCGLSVLILSIAVGGVLGWREAGRRQLRGLSGIARAYAMLNVAASWLGLKLPASHTPDERAAALSEEMPEAAAPIHEITSLYAWERFSPTQGEAEANRRAGDAWQSVRPSVVRRLFARLWRRRSGPDR